MTKLWHIVPFWALLWLFLPGPAAGQCTFTVDAGPDQTVCGLGNTAQLNGNVIGNFESFQWSPAAGLSNPNSLSPIANLTGTYTLTATGTSNINLITNGDFEQGVSGFTSDYDASPIPILNGTYTTVISPSLVVNTFPPCDDHTFGNGTGQMLLVNGDGNPGENVWCQTVSVTPNTNYDLSAWVSTLVPLGLAQLQFSVNGQLLGAPVTASPVSCEWNPFAASWNSGNSTTAEVCIVTQSTDGFGNDFVLDDIEMYGECELSDAVDVEILPNAVNDVQAYRCFGDCFFIGGTPYCNSGFYTQTLTAANGCDSTVNLQLTVLNPVAFIADPDTLSCYNDFAITLDGSGSSSGPFTTYQWSGPNGFTSNLASPLVTSPGTYTLEVVAQAGNASCSSTASVTVIQEATEPEADAGEDVFIPCDADTASLNGSGSGSGAGLAYEWAGPNGFSSSLPQPIVDTGGLYVLEVADSLSGCTNTDTVAVAVDTNALSLEAMADTLTCSQPVAGLSAAVDSSAVSFLWSGPEGFSDTTLSAEANLPGLYVLEAADTSGCQAVDTVEVVADTLPVAFALGSASLSCNQLTDSLSVALDTAYAALLWSGPGGFSDSLPQVLIDSPGIYQLQLTGTNGCTAMDSVVVEGDFSGPALSVAGDTLDCGANGAVVSGSSPDTVISWEWSGPGGPLGTAPTLSVDSPGAYVLSATGSNGCTSQDTALVVLGADIPQLAAIGGTLDCNTSSVNLRGSTNGEASLSWSGPDGFFSTNPNPIVSQPGFYTLTADSGNGCSSDTTVQVVADTLPPSLSLSGGRLTCLQDTVWLQPLSDSSALAYQWSLPSGITSTQPELAAVVPGIYNLTLTADNGCRATASAVVEQDTIRPALSPSAPAISCNMPSVNLSPGASGDSLSFNWTGPAGYSSTLAAPAVNQPGAYQLELTDLENGCSQLREIRVEADTLPPQLEGQGDTLNCAQPALELDASASGSIVDLQWAGPDGFSSNALNPLVSQAGLYQLQAVGGNGCRDSLSLTVGIDTLPPVLEAASDTLNCAAPQTVLQASADAGSTLSWSGPNGFSGTGDSILIDQAGNYQLTATGSNGCTATEVLEIPIDTLPPTAEASGGVLSCAQPSVVLSGNAGQMGHQISWAGPQGFASDALDPTVTAPGRYILTVAAPNGCTASDTAWVTADNLPPDLLLSDDTLTCSAPSLELQPQSSASGLLYEWTGPGGIVYNQPNPTVGQAGLYQLTVTAPNGCTATDSLRIVTDQAPPSINPAGGSITCAQAVVQMQPGASVSGLQYQWSGPAGFSSDAASPSADLPGLYELRATAPNGCTASEVVEIEADTVPPALQLSADTLSCAQPTVSITVNSDLPAVFDWSGPNGFSSASAAPVVGQAGLYELTATAANGCTSVETVEVSGSSEAPELQAVGDTLSCNAPVAVLQGTASDSLAQLAWSGPGGYLASGAETTTTEAGMYLFTATAQNGCRDSVQVNVVADTLAPVLSAEDVRLDCNTPELPLDAELESGTIASVQWSGPGGFVADSLQPLVRAAGIYTLTVTAPNGCQGQATATVELDTLPPEFSLLTSNSLNCAQPTAVLRAEGLSAGAHQFSWQRDGAALPAEGDSVVASQAGEYRLRAEREDNGCSYADSLQLAADFTPAEAEIAVPNGGVLDCRFDSLRLAAASTQPADSLLLAWQSPAGETLGSDSSLWVAAPGRYRLLVAQAVSECRDTAELEVQINRELPTVSVVPPPPINCERSSVAIDATASSSGAGFQPVWTSVDGNLASGLSSLNPTVEAGGLYQLRILNEANGCADSMEVEVAWDTIAPVAVASAQGILDCLRDTVRLLSEGSTIGAAVEAAWSTVDGSFGDSPLAPNSSAVAAGRYVLNVTNTQNGCTGRDTVLVEENTAEPEGLQLDVVPPYCFDGFGQIRVLGVQGGNPPYLFAIDGGSLSSQKNFEGLSSGAHTLLVEDALGCRWQQTVVVPEPAVLEASLPSQLELSFNDSLTLSPLLSFPDSVIQSVQWSPSQYLSCSDCLQPVVQQPNQSVAYELTVITEEGCSAEAEVLLLVNKEREVYFPNAFSPGNQDGNNDGFTAFGPADKIESILRLRVFDRWGGLVFERRGFEPNKPDAGWDGTHRGEEAAAGVYVYTALVQFADGRVVEYRGSLSLMR